MTNYLSLVVLGNGKLCTEDTVYPHSHMFYFAFMYIEKKVTGKIIFMIKTVSK